MSALTPDAILQIKISMVEWMRKAAKKDYVKLILDGIYNQWPGEFYDLKTELEKYKQSLSDTKLSDTERRKIKKQIDIYLFQYFDINNIDRIIQRDPAKFHDFIKIKI
jgi:hypothetical protein